MGRWSSFLRLPVRDKRLVAQAAVVLASIRLGLRVLPFETLRRILARVARPGNAVPPDESVRERTLWAIERVGREMPIIGTCLTQALASHVLLGRLGCRANLRIGVKRDDDGEFVAHAWLEKDGIVLIGEAGHQSYSPMPALDGLDP